MNNEKGSIIPGTESDKVVIVGQNEKKFATPKWNIVPKKGHTLFEINMETGDVRIPEYEQINLQINDMGQAPVNMHLQVLAVGKGIPQQEIKKKLITKPGCIYISALNIQNAAKQFVKRSALNWWVKLSNAEKDAICKLFFPAKNRGSITDQDIIKLWHMENAANANENKNEL